MKKITLLFFMILVTKGFAQFPEHFDAGTSDMPTGWVSFIGDNGYGTTKNWNISETGEYAFVEPEDVSPNTSEDWLVTPQFTVGGSQYILSFSQTDFYAEDNGSVYTIRVSTTDQTTPADFTTVATYYETDMSTGTFSPAYVDLSAYAGQSIYVAFVLTQQNGDYWYIDDVNVTGDATVPYAALNPTPADTAIDVLIDDSNNTQSINMSWTPATSGDPAAYYKVYYGDTAENMLYLGSVTNPEITVDNCLYNQTYYWKVVPTNVAGDAIGTVTWSYTTQATDLAIDNVDNNNFSVYPNPTTGTVRINGSNNITSITIANQIGQQLKTINGDTLLNNTLNIQDLDSGIYFLTISSNTKNQSIKLIKS